MNALDAGLLAFLALMAYTGYKKGLLRSVAGLAAYIAAAAAALIAGPSASAWLRTNTAIGRDIEQYVTDRLADTPYGALLGADAGPVGGVPLRELPQLQALADGNPLLRLLLFGRTEDGVPLLHVLAASIVTALVVLALFIAVRLALALLLRLLASGVERAPLLGGVNRLAGLALNVASGCIVIAVGALAAGQLALRAEGGEPPAYIADSFMMNAAYRALGQLFAALLQG